MKENEIPSTVFRMKNKYHLDLYIQSRSIIIVDRWTKQPKCIVSVNTALRYVQAFKVNGYTFKGGNSAIFILPPSH